MTAPLTKVCGAVVILILLAAGVAHYSDLTPSYFKAHYSELTPSYINSHLNDTTILYSNGTEAPGFSPPSARKCGYDSNGNVIQDNRKNLKKPTKKVGCMMFRCRWGADDNLPTDYEGKEPPFCIHLMRDMARIFDEEMCRIGLDYASLFGTLLGWKRNDRIIPWTTDLDYMIPTKAVVDKMIERWDKKRTGIAMLFQGIHRMCLTENFAGGKLAKWKEKFVKPNIGIDASGVPYIDLYVGKNITSFTSSGTSKDLKSKKNLEAYQFFNNCQVYYRQVFPTRQMPVYNGSFSQRMPANPEQLLRTSYGVDWITPPKDHKKHGGKPCPYSPTQ